MAAYEVVDEGTVLVATIRYLIRNGSIPTDVSVARGKGIKPKEIGVRVKRVFREESKKSAKLLKFRGSDPDIVAVSDKSFWKVECKGSGTGKPATLRNNFDRALASVVSYYEDCPPKAGKLFLGLALPASELYLKQLETRVGVPLRKRLNLWILLYDRKRGNIQPMEPKQVITAGKGAVVILT